MAIVQILCNDILPLLLFMGMGYLLDRKFKLDLNTYNKLVIWVVLPSFIFYSMSQYRPSPDTFFLIPAMALLIIGMSLLARCSARLFSLSGPKRAIFEVTSAYSNAGNIGIALIVFIYSHAPYAEGNEAPYLTEARGSIILLLIVMNMAVNLFGACQIRSGTFSAGQILRFLLRMPALYAVAAGLFVQYAGLSLSSTFLWPVLHHFSGAYIVLITIIVGAHLRRSRLRRPDLPTLAAAFQKLIIAPLIAVLIITGMGCFTPVEAQVFLIASSIPPSFTIVMYAAEYDNHPDFAAQSILTSTFLGILTMTAVIYAARLLYPAGL